MKDKIEILIFDTSVHYLKSMKKYLSNDFTDNLIISSATEITKALDHMAQNNPDILIMEMSSTEKSSMEFLNSIEDNNLKTIPIASSIYKDLRKPCLHAGIQYFFDKTDSIKKLKLLIELIINNKSLKK